MKKYLVYCNFATLKCNQQQFYKFLVTDFPDVQNINGNIWIMSDSSLNEIPFNTDAKNLLQELQRIGYADKDSVVFIAEVSNVYGNFESSELFFQ